MLSALALSLAQLGDRRILAVIAKSLALTLTVFALLGVGLWFALAAWNPTDGNGGFVSAILVGLVLIVSLWLLFRLVALAVLQLFADEVVEAVEARHYPATAASARKLGLAEELRQGLRGLGRALGYNLLALPVALLLLPTAVGPAVVFALVNAVLLGRELSDMVTLRHTGAAIPGQLTRMMLGGVVVLLLMVPLVNLLAPVLGAAMATHLVHRGKKTS